MARDSVGAIELTDSEDELLGSTQSHSPVDDGGSLVFVSEVENPSGLTNSLDSKTDHFVQKNGFSIVVPPATRRWEYQVYEQPPVETILHEYGGDDGISYLVRFSDGAEELVSIGHFVLLPR